MGNPLPVSLPSECRKAAKIFNDFVDPVHGLDKVVPLSVLRKAKGFAIFSVFRIGVLMSARAGSGLVIAKTEQGEWSAPAAIGLGGLGGGFNAGAELTDFLIVLNSTSAVRSFMATGSLQLGGNLSVAVGPLGRTGEVSGSLSSSGGAAAMFSYSKSKGLYGGVSVEGTILVDRSDANSKAYGRNVTSKVILSGNVDVPDFARPFVGTVERITRTGGAVGAGLDGDFSNMGIGGEDYYGGGGRYSDNERDEEELDEYGYPISSKASKRVKGKRESEWDEGGSSQGTGMSRQWSDTDRQWKRENETRNVGQYVFGSAAAHDENDPFAERNASTSSSRHRTSPSYSRSSVSRNGGATNYAREDTTDVLHNGSAYPERPRHTRNKSSKGSFSFSSLRNKGKTPPPFSDYDHLNPQGSLSKTTYDPPSTVAKAAPRTNFPTKFANDFGASSSEDENNRAAEQPSSGPSNPNSRQWSSKYSSSSSNNVTRRDDADQAGEYSWDESERDANSRQRYMDDFDRELQSVPTSASPVSHRTSSRQSFKNGNAVNGASKSSNSSRTRSGSNATSAGTAGRRSTTPTWARNLNFTNSSANGRRSSSARAEDLNDPFYETYDEARAVGLRTDLVGAEAARRKIKSYDPPPARGPVSAPSPSHNHHDLSTVDEYPSHAPAFPPRHVSNGAADQVVAAFDFGGAQAGDLPFRRGDVIDVLRRTASREDWWHGRCRGREGDFPANYTEDV